MIYLKKELLIKELEKAFAEESLWIIKKYLSNYTTIKIGPEVLMLFPKNQTELLKLITFLIQKDIKYIVLGKGSNILPIKSEYQEVFINLSRLRDISFCNNEINIEAGVTNQELIQQCKNKGLGGLEFMYCIPGTVGGAVVMNAGRAKQYNLTISNFIKTVEFFDGEEIHKLDKSSCLFDHRFSIFLTKKNWIITKILLQLPYQDSTVTNQKIQERMLFVKSTQDLNYPNFGSVFSENFKIPTLGFKIENAKFSHKTPNWICNLGEKSSTNILRLIEYAQELHLKENLPPPIKEIIYI
jgi:UDP-N-acetylmuramate dehydrogenase